MKAVTGNQQRWADLPADERRRREAQSAADRERARTGAAKLSEAERRRRQDQSAVDRERAADEDAVYNTIYGGDINMMDKHDW